MLDPDPGIPVCLKYFIWIYDLMVCALEIKITMTLRYFLEILKSLETLVEDIKLSSMQIISFIYVFIFIYLYCPVQFIPQVFKARAWGGHWTFDLCLWKHFCFFYLTVTGLKKFPMILNTGTLLIISLTKPSQGYNGCVRACMQCRDYFLRLKSQMSKKSTESVSCTWIC